MKIIDNESKKIYELKSIDYDSTFQRTIYRFYSTNCSWSIPVYNNETLNQVLEKNNLSIDK